MPEPFTASSVERLRCQPSFGRRGAIRPDPCHGCEVPAPRRAPTQNRAAGHRSATTSNSPARPAPAHKRRSNRSSPSGRHDSRAANVSASACTSPKPRFSPWPASGCTTCAASPTSTQPAPHTGLRAGDGQRPRRPWAGQAQPGRHVGAGALQFGFEGSRVQLHQRGGTLLRQRPHQRERSLGQRPLERQQRQHVGRTKPLMGHALMRVGRGQPRGDGGLAVGVAIELHADRLARAESLPSA